MSYFKSFLMRYWYYLVIGVLLILLIISSILLYFSWDEGVNENADVIALKEDAQPEEKLLENESSIKMCTVDVKGAVKKTGVYEIECNKKINDVLAMAGGKTKSAYTDNINLSKTISDEMVLYVYTTKEIKASSKEITKKEEVVSTPCISENIYIDSCLEEDKSVITSQNKNDIIISENKPVESDKNSGDNEEVNNPIVDNGNDEKTENENETNIETKLISLNNATKEELMTLSGIGESKAEKIIIYREENNGFKNIEELKNVSGIGDAIFEKIKFNISI